MLQHDIYAVPDIGDHLRIKIERRQLFPEFLIFCPERITLTAAFAQVIGCEIVGFQITA